MTYFYHVLNDYSLELIPDDALYFKGRTSPDPATYRANKSNITIKRDVLFSVPVTLYTHIEFNELHYLSSVRNDLEEEQI